VASQIRTPFSSIAANTGWRSPGELLIIWRTFEVAVCCSNASFNWLLSRAISVSWLAAEELRGRAPFRLLRSFAFAVLRRRASTGPPLTLERRFNVSPTLRTKWSSLSLAQRKWRGGTLIADVNASTYVTLDLDGV
jgi:hypothetical protein